MCCSSERAQPLQYQLLVVMPDGRIPVHYVTAQQNVATLIKNRMAAKSKLADESGVDVDTYVVLRVGHATHADFEGAVEMASLKVLADKKLESNLATRSLSLKEDVAIESYEIDVPSYKIASSFLGHLFLPLLVSGVHITLGTDGAGVEHSDPFNQLLLAQELITAFKNSCTMKPKSISCAYAVSRTK